MAAPLQTFLFNHGAEMTGKRIGLIVSSASSGISNVESDAKRLIPNGNFLTPSLWIRSSQTLQLPFDDNGMAEKNRLHGIKGDGMKKRYSCFISAAGETRISCGRGCRDR